VGLSSGSCVPLARRSAPGEGWRFDASAFGLALGELRAEAALTVIDEIGHLELAGRGHAELLSRVLATSPAVLAVVREELADEIAKRLAEAAEVTILRFEPGREDEMIDRIRGAARRHS